MRTFTALLALLLFVGTSQPVLSADLGPGAGGRFHFYSDPGINLYHFLYHWTRADEQERRLRGRVPIQQADADVALLQEHQAVWDAAVDRMRPSIAKDLLFDEDMWRLKEAIARGFEGAENDPVLAALKLALPVYERYWWPRHDAANQAIHAELSPLLMSHGEGLAATVAAAYQSDWGDDPIRVDLVAYANWAGAYTSNFPNHIVLSSMDERHERLQALEILFHEAGHTRPLGERVMPTTARVAEELGLEEGRLWHSILFFVTGQAMLDALPPETAATYTPYAQKNGLWDRRGMAVHGPALQQGWEGHDTLEGRVRAVFALMARGAEKARLPDPLAAGWHGEPVCERLHEDDSQRVLRCTFPPNVGHERHFHSRHFGYALAGGRVRITDASGIREVELSTASSFSSSGVAWHEILNIGETTVVYLIVEPR